MSGFTEKAIIETFTRLLNERPLDKITVTDISRACGINRNTFYYHFADIYDLLDKVLAAESNRILEGAHEDFSTWQQAALEGTRFARENKDAIYHIYRSVRRDRLDRYLFEAIGNAISRFVMMQAEGLSVDQKSIKDITDFMSSAIEGIIINWLSNGMKGNPEEFIEMIGSLADGLVRQLLERASTTE